MRHIVLAKQAADPARHFPNDIGLALHHARQIECNTLDHDAVNTQRGLCAVKQFARFQQGLARNTTHIEAGAAQCAFFNARHAHAQLRRANRSDISPRPCADNDEIKCRVCHGYTHSISSCPYPTSHQSGFSSALKIEIANEKNKKSRYCLSSLKVTMGSVPTEIRTGPCACPYG